MSIFWKRDKLHLKQPSDSVSGTLLGSSDPKITQSDSKVTLKWPQVTQGDPKVTLEWHKLTPSDPKVTLK